MQQVTYIHSRSSSPTMRPVSWDANIAAGEPGAQDGSGSASRPVSRAIIPSQFDGLSKTRVHPDGTTEYRRPGQTYTTVVRPVDHDELPLEHVHQVLDCGYLSSMTLPTELLRRLEASFGGAPIMDSAERTSSSLARGTAGKAPLDAAVQTLSNSIGVCRDLKADYRAFANDACAILRAHASGYGAGSPAVTVPLKRILATVWPTLRFKSHEERNAWMQRTMQDPKPFVAQSFDVLDLALAQVVVATPVAKEKIVATWDCRSEAEKDAIFEYFKASDAALADAHLTFTDRSIPIDDQLLKGHSLAATLRA